MKAAAIPATQGLNPETRKVLDATIEVLETVTGRRRGMAKLPQLPANATLPEIVAAYNALLARIQV